jgi:cell division protein FtsZ
MTIQHKIAPVSGVLKKKIRLKVFGVGSAGCNAVEHMSQGDFKDVDFVAINTDLQSLLALSAACVLPLGAKLTRGLGTGGDIEVGRAAAEEETEQLRNLCEEAEVVVIVTGLGGGVGTGASPVLARVAKETGALVLAVATLPFDCEGTNRQEQAMRGLQVLQEAADAVICLPNQRVLKTLDGKTSLVDTFKVANELLAQSLRGIWRLFARSGIINVDFADLCAVVRGRHGESSFATAESRGEHRARDVVDLLMKSPLLDDGAVLREAESVLVSLAGGTDLTMVEVNRVMAQINRACENGRIVMGAVVSEEMNGRLSVTVIATRGRPAAVAKLGSEAEPEPVEENEGAALKDLRRTPADEAPDLGTEFFQAAAAARPASRFLPPPPDLTAERKEQILAQQKGGRPYRKPGSKMRQAMLPLEIVSKGRFEKSEPTVYQGEDLDMPTYVRRGVPLN